MPLKDIDFVLVWDGSSEAGSSEEGREKRRIFEKNLEEEGLLLEREKMDANSLNFVKIHAPLEVLRRYSEILKIRMPMREVSNIF
jgi:anoctamin-1